jgi:DNA (cytosine-5)-methyltransferase 1
MENVKGMLSAAIRHRPLDERGPGFPPLSSDEELGSALKVIRDELAELNYYVIFGLVNCADYGVPQQRHRVVFIGSRDGEDVILPEPTHSINCDNGKTRWATLRDAIANLSGKQEFVPLPADRKKLLKLLKAGQNWRDLPDKLHRAALGAAADTWGGRSGFCRRLIWDMPAPTLTTDPVGRATTLCHPTRLRPLSVQEYARLQQFPTDWIFSGKARQKYTQIGNAVPLGLGSAIGRMLEDVATQTDKRDSPPQSKSRLGTVVCADSKLEKWLTNRRKTQLHPPWRRVNGDIEAGKKWLALVGS